MEQKDTVQFRLELKGDLAKKFLFLKEKYGVLKNTELVRILIEQEYQRKIGH